MFWVCALCRQHQRALSSLRSYGFKESGTKMSFCGAETGLVGRVAGASEGSCCAKTDCAIGKVAAVRSSEKRNRFGQKYSLNHNYRHNIVQKDKNIVFSYFFFANSEKMFSFALEI